MVLSATSPFLAMMMTLLILFITTQASVKSDTRVTKILLTLEFLSLNEYCWQLRFH